LILCRIINADTNGEVDVKIIGVENVSKLAVSLTIQTIFAPGAI
jgi:hypothetical protein